MLRLASDTPKEWVVGLLPHLDLVLLDHAHCEKKAASTAMNLIFRYQHLPELMRPLSELAREELEHFELCLTLLEARGIPFRRLRPSPYAKALHEACRTKEPEQLLDLLLVCSLIEARSCERMKLLSEELKGHDDELAALYASLLASEARHHSLYVDMALQRYDHDDVFARLTELAEVEADVLRRPAPFVRMHT